MLESKSLNGSPALSLLGEVLFAISDIYRIAYSLPNHGVQLTAYSVRSFVAPAFGSS